MLFRLDLEFARFLCVCIVAALCFGSPALAVQDDGELPTAKEVIEQHILAIGGYEVLSSISSTRKVWTKKDSRGSWKFERWRTPGQKFATNSLDGNVVRTYGCWVANPSAGVKSLKGVGWEQYGDHVQIQNRRALQENLVDSATIDDRTHWFERHKSIEVKGKEKVGGRDCYLLEFTNLDEEVSNMCFDCETFYRVQAIGAEHRSGGTEVTRTYSGFKEVNGIVVAMEQKIVSDLGTDVWQLKEFEHDGEFDIEAFPTPNSVLALIAKLEAELQRESEKLVEK